ncbi:MAG TPA: hypothetical protein VF077_09710 [Nitrospiraceae bacterium]
MAYVPVNVDAYTNAYSGAIAGMAISGWIVDPDSADYANVAAIAGAFAEAFDTVWNDATELDWLQIQSIQSVCQNQFTGHAPGSLDTDSFFLAGSWAVPAAACAALVLQGDAYVSSQGITPNTPGGGGGAPIYHQFYLDSTKAAGGNGAISKPFNAWADIVAAAVAAGATDQSTFFFAQTIDGTATPIPNYGGGPHGNTPALVLKGVAFEANVSLTGLSFDTQDTGGFKLTLEDMLLVGTVFTAGLNIELVATDSILVTTSETAPSVAGTAHVVNCRLSGFTLPSVNLTMQGGAVETTVDTKIGILDSVLFRAGVQFRWTTTLNLTNCRFEGGVQLLVDANQPLTLDLDTWGAMIAAGVTFPDTDPVLTIVPAPSSLTGTFAARPAPTSNGQQYFATDGVVGQWVVDATPVWRPVVVGVLGFEVPDLATFNAAWTIFNGGGIFNTAANGGLLFQGVTDATVHNRGWFLPVDDTADISIEAGLEDMSLGFGGGGRTVIWGVGFRNSVSGEAFVLSFAKADEIGGTIGFIDLSTWSADNTRTSFSQPRFSGNGNGPGGPMFLRVRRVSGNFIADVSTDRRTWAELSAGAATFTADQVIIATDVVNGPATPQFMLLSLLTDDGL